MTALRELLAEAASTLVGAVAAPIGQYLDTNGEFSRSRLDDGCLADLGLKRDK